MLPTLFYRPTWNPSFRPQPVSTVFAVCTALAMYDNDIRRPMSDDQITDLAVAFRLAFHQMLNGHASEENWSVCVCSLNIAVVLAEWGYGEEYIPRINDALEGAFRAKLRAGRYGKWGFDGDAIQAIKDAFEIHEQQIAAVSKQEIYKALHLVHDRIRRGVVFEEAA